MSKKKLKTYYFLAACVGECCTAPHLVDVKVQADTQPNAHDKAKKKLGKNGWFVGDMTDVPYSEKEAETFMKRRRK
jgi:hypothetical protein